MSPFIKYCTTISNISELDRCFNLNMPFPEALIDREDMSQMLCSEDPVSLIIPMALRDRSQDVMNSVASDSNGPYEESELIPPESEVRSLPEGQLVAIASRGCVFRGGLSYASSWLEKRPLLRSCVFNQASLTQALESQLQNMEEGCLVIADMESHPIDDVIDFIIDFLIRVSRKKITMVINLGSSGRRLASVTEMTNFHWDEGLEAYIQKRNFDSQIFKIEDNWTLVVR